MVGDLFFPLLKEFCLRTSPLGVWKTTPTSTSIATSKKLGMVFETSAI